MISFGPEITNDLAEATSREWLETNGLGGFASSTVAGINTRRYHGLLFAATKPPVGRLLMLSKFEETLIVNGERFDLSANRYEGTVFPEGFRYLKSFRLDPFPVFTFEAGGIEIVKSVFMLNRQNTTVLQYEARQVGNGKRLPAEVNCNLELKPLIAFRDYHSTAHENPSFNQHYQAEKGLVTFQPYFDLPPLHLAHNADKLEPAGYWYKDFEYEREIERGFSDTEDLFNPCVLLFDLNRSPEANLIASTERRSASKASDFREREIERRKGAVAPSRYNDALARSLVAAADQFIVRRGSQKTVIAGYHWFGDWGRDTMISLPGLALVTGRIDVAQSILSEFARHVSEGMLPNRFPDAGENPEYNTVDATLWYFEAIRSLIHYSRDLSYVRENLYDILTDIIDWHVHGTRYNIHVDVDGLLYAGEPGVQLTWMDAKVGDWVVTPRIGKPVEIQALWYNALRIMAELSEQFGDSRRRSDYEAMAERAKASFNAKFWNEEKGYLFDVIDDEHRDGSIRPNQIFAVSLPHTMLDHNRALKIVDVVQRELLTPYGLRSLSPRDPNYIGQYRGGPRERDGAYHQGTVWGWLMGPFITAYIRVNEGSRESRAQAEQWLAPFREHLSQAGLGQISEIFDGDAPHRPAGCIAQAWSVAEVLRATLEDAENYGHITWQVHAKRDVASAT